MFFERAVNSAAAEFTSCMLTVGAWTSFAMAFSESSNLTYDRSILFFLEQTFL